MVDHEIRISVRTVVALALLAAGVWLVVELRTVLLFVFVALLIALALDPFVDGLVRRRVARPVAVFLVFLAVILFFLGIGALGITPLIEQTRHFFQNLPEILAVSAQSPSAPGLLRQLGDALSKQLSSLPGSILAATWGAFSGVLSVVSVVILSIYILSDLENIKRLSLKLLSKAGRFEADGFLDEVEERLGSWLRGELVLMLCVGAMTFLGLTLLGVDYVVPLSLIAGLLEIVPTIGPIISTVPAAIVGFSISPLTGLGVVALFILVQQLENNLIVPKVMQRAVGFAPLVTLIIILIGGKLLGFGGVLLAIPAALIVETLVHRLPKH